MSVTLTPQVNRCPNCRTELTVPASGPGQQLICAACRHRFVPPWLAVTTQVSRKAVASLVLGLASFLAICVTGMLAIAFGIFALVDIGQSRGRLTGKKMAITGIVLGAILGVPYIPVWLSLGIPLIQMLRPGQGVQVAPVPLADPAGESEQLDNGLTFLTVPIKPGETAEEAVARVDAFLAEAIKSPVAAADRLIAKNRFSFEFQTVRQPDSIAAQNLYGLAFTAGLRAKLGLDTRDFGKAIDDVTAEHWDRVSQAVLSADRRVVIVATPK